MRILAAKDHRMGHVIPGMGPVVARPLGGREASSNTKPRPGWPERGFMMCSVYWITKRCVRRVSPERTFTR